MKKIALTILLTGVIWAPALGDYEPVDVPLRQVVLFSSGVGYFQHGGTVKGNTTATLMFKTDQINDVLKSMVLMDFGGGTISSVSYGSRAPLTRALKSFAVDISDNPDMAKLLERLRGAEIVVEAPDKIAGKILGVEKRKKQFTAGGVATIIEEVILNIATGEGIKSVPMSTVQNLNLKDKKLAGELNQALELLIASHDTQRRGMTVRFTGKGKRDVSVGYIIEAPVWKTSYRLVLSGKKPGLQGWAIVENTTDADWKQVQLVLVSGRPISFIQDLYTPLYLSRPVVRPKMYASLKPRMYDEGIESKAKMAKDIVHGAPAREYAARSMAGRPAMLARAAKEESLLRTVVLDQGVEAIAAAQEVGELFRFSIEAPVDLARRQSAMLPIVNCPIAAEKVSIYNPAVLRTHPLNGAYLTNNTDLKIPAGPVTVFDEGVYAGDAQIDDMVPNDKRLISYAVDLNVSVDSSQKSSTSIISGQIDRGALYIKHRRLYTHKYVIKNKSDQARQVIVEHPFHAKRKLLKPDKYEEKTPKLYRFRLPVEPEATEDFAVETEQVHFETVGIVDSAIDLLLRYSKRGEISEKVRQALAKAIRMKQQVTELVQRLEDLTKQKRDIEVGQERLRRNLNSVGRTSSLGRRYLKTMSQQEDQIEALGKQIDTTRAKLEAKRAELRQYLDGLKVD